MMRFDDRKILKWTFGFLFCVSLLLNIFYLVGCNDEDADPVQRATQERVVPDLTNPDIRYGELLQLYHHAKESWRKTTYWEKETAYANILLQIISILEMRGDDTLVEGSD